MANANGRTLGDAIADLKVEAKEFVQTRVQMLRSEMKEKVSAWKAAMPMIGVAVLFGITAWLVLTAALVSVIAGAFAPNPYAVFYATLIVGFGYLLIAGIAGWAGYAEIKRHGGMAPGRTMEVLKQDQVWIKNETTKAA